MFAVHEQYHPDRLRLKEPSAVDSTSNKFLEIEAAWRVLSDQNTRRQYDLQCKGRNETKVKTVSNQKGYSYHFLNCQVSKETDRFSRKRTNMTHCKTKKT